MSFRQFLRGLFSPDDRVLGINRRNLDLVFADYRPGRFRELDDKLLSKERMTAEGVAVPRTLGVIRDPGELDRLDALLAPLDELVIKPAKGWGGRGILVLRREGEAFVQGGERYDRARLRQHVGDILDGIFSLEEASDAAILEERIHPHEFFAGLYPDGLSDLRVVLQGGRPLQAMLRVPTALSGGKANLHGGGVGVGVDVETGRLTGGIWKDRDIEAHPDSGAALEGPSLPHWERCLEMARRAANGVDVDYVGVDLVVDRDRGPLVLEVNARPGLAIQIANRAAQPATFAPAPGRAERWSFRVTWLLLLALACGPFVFERWQEGHVGAEEIRTLASTPGGVGAEERELGFEPAGTDWDDEEIPLSEQDERFRQARLAAAQGDTTRALELYASATGDSTVAPFVFNNVALIHRQRGELPEALEMLQEAVRRLPTYARGHYNLGLVLLDLGRPDEAEASFLETLRLRPSHHRSWAQIGGLHFDRREFEQAVEAYGRAIRYEPSSRAYRVRLGLALRLMDRVDAAAERFAEARALDPASEAAAYWWARSTLDLLHDGAMAGADRDSVARVLRDWKDSERCRLLEAGVAFERGRAWLGLRICRSLHEDGTRGRRLATIGAVCALELGLWSEAEEWLGRLRDDERRERAEERRWLGALLENPVDAPEVVGALRSWRPRDPALAALRGELLDPRAPSPAPSPAPERLPSWEERLGQPTVPPELRLWAELRRHEAAGRDSLAAIVLTTLETFQPDFAPVLQRALTRELEAGRTGPALRHARRLNALRPDDAELLLQLVDLSLRARETRRARQALEDLPGARRARADARVLEGRLLLQEGSPVAATRLVQRLLEQSPEDVEAQVILGRAWRARGRDDRAIDALQRARDRAPARAEVRELLALSLMTEKRYEEAAREWARVLQLGEGPQHSERFQHALALQRSGALEEALAAWDRFVELRPEHYKAWYNRALALERLGREEAARAGFEHVLTLKPDHAGSLKKLGRPTSKD